jgi:hypothetical protein
MPVLNREKKYIILSEKLGYHLILYRTTQKMILDVSAKYSDMVAMVKAVSLGSCFRYLLLLLLQSNYSGITVTSVLAHRVSEVATLLLEYYYYLA